MSNRVDEYYVLHNPDKGYFVDFGYESNDPDDVLTCKTCEISGSVFFNYKASGFKSFPFDTTLKGFRIIKVTRTTTVELKTEEV